MTAKLNKEQTPKQASKPHDLDSIMRLLKEYQVPSTMKPMQNVVYSTVQMFAASWLANTQTLCKYHDELTDQKDYIERLESKITNMETLIQNHSQNTEQSVDNTLNERLMHIETTVEQLSSKIKLFEENKNVNTEDHDYTVVHAEKEYQNNNDTNIKALEEQSVKLQDITDAHSKKIRELIKRYRKDHSELIDVRNQMNELEEEIACFKNNDINNNAITHTSEHQQQIITKMEELEQSMISNLEQMKEDLSGHETEHEGIINEVIGQLDNLKVNVSEMETKLKNNHHPVSEMDEAAINNLVLRRTEKVAKEMHRVIVNKTSKLEKLMSKIVGYDINKTKGRKNNNSKPRVASPLSIKANQNNYLVPSIIQCDLNTSSSAANIVNITLDDDLDIKPITPKVMHSPRAGSPSSKSKGKRRLRSTSFGERYHMSQGSGLRSMPKNNRRSI